jgi:hypothetical protein
MRRRHRLCDASPHLEAAKQRKTEIHCPRQISAMLVADDLGWRELRDHGVQELPRRAEDIRDPDCAGRVVRDPSGDIAWRRKARRPHRPLAEPKPREIFAPLRNRRAAAVFARRAKGKWRNVEMLRKILSAAAIGAVAVMMSTFSASAAIVCQGQTCWHTHGAYDFPHEAGVVVHEDNWHWGPHEKFAFREHEGRGYWRGGKWVVW